MSAAAMLGHGPGTPPLPASIRVTESATRISAAMSLTPLSSGPETSWPVASTAVRAFADRPRAPLAEAPRVSVDRVGWASAVAASGFRRATKAAPAAL